MAPSRLNHNAWIPLDEIIFASRTYGCPGHFNFFTEGLTERRRIQGMCDAEHRLLAFTLLVGTGLFTLTTGCLARDEGLGVVGSVCLMAATVGACLCGRRSVYATASATASATEPIVHVAAPNRDKITVSTMYDNF